MTAESPPAAEVAIDDDLVRRLLDEQLPEFAARPLRKVAEGWDNVIYRIGNDLTVRLPRRQMAASLVEHEQRWLPTLAARLPLAIPAPVGFGRPGLGYPWSWSVCPWLPGEVAQLEPPADLHAGATALGEFLAALHEPAPADAPDNPYRGGPLSDRAPFFYERVERMHAVIDGAAILVRFAELLATPRWAGPPLWLHGDLHPANVLVHDRRVSAVIDFGDITSGDPATDFSIAWMLFPAAERATMRSAAGGVDDDTWNRARGWALALAVTYLASSANRPVIEREAQRTMAEVLADS